MQIGLVGCGRWGRLILRDLRSLGANVVVAAPSEATRAQSVELGAVAAVATAGELPDLDGYVVAPPTVLHAETVETLLPRNRPIFVEKPLTNDPAAADRILAAAPDRVFCMDKWRYHGGVLKLADLAKRGALGDVLAVRSWRLGWGNPHRDVDAAWILLPHDLSIALEILGRLPPLRHAHGIAAGPIGESLSAVLVDPAGGPSVEMEISSSHPVNRRSVAVIGSEAVAQFGDSYDRALRLNRPGAEPEEIPVETEMPLLAELRAFVEHIAGGPPPKSNAAEAALIVHRVAEMRAAAGFATP
ncbi:MAG: Gfo/Idh/MocA family protein [Paracoccaceae bacterium]